MVFANNDPYFEPPPGCAAEAGGDEEDVYETIASFAVPVEAHIYRAHLEAQGIPVLLADEHVTGLNWIILPEGGVRLQVPRSRLRAASEIIEAVHSGACELGDLGPDASFPPPLDSSEFETEALLACTHDPETVTRWSARADTAWPGAEFNLMAAFFGLPWFVLRRLYAAGAVVLAADSVAFALPCIAARWFGGEEASYAAGLSASSPSWLAAGYAYGELYRRHCLALVRRVRLAVASHAGAIAALKRRSWPNFGGTVTSLVFLPVYFGLLGGRLY